MTHRSENLFTTNRDANTADLEQLYKTNPNVAFSPDTINNFNKNYCVLPSTLCMAGEGLKKSIT